MDQELKITYLIEAIDKATKVMEQIEKQLGSMDAAYSKSNKQTDEFNKNQKTIAESLKAMPSAASRAVSSIKNYYDMLSNFDFDKLVKNLNLVAFVLSRMGFGAVADQIKVASMAVKNVGDKFQEFQGKIEETREKYGSFLRMFLELTGLDHLISALGKATLSVGAFGAAFVGLAATKGGIDFLQSVFGQIAKLHQVFGDFITLVGGRFPKIAEVLWQGFGIIGNKLTVLQLEMATLHFRIGETITNMVKIKDTAITTGQTFLKAASHTEIMEKGLLGVATRAAASAGIFVALGKVLLETDSTLAKISGTVLMGFAFALGGIAVVIKNLMVTVGGFIEQIGTGLVNSMQASVDKFVKMESTTFNFAFILKNLSKETNGAIGTFEEWDKIATDFSKTMRFTTSETQQSISEMLRFGDSIGMTKGQMQKLLPIIADLAKANHKDLFTTTIGVMEALNGQTQMLQNMGVNLTEHALKESNVAKAMKVRLGSLNATETAQLRYNLLLEKSSAIHGVAEASAGTLQGATESLEYSWNNLSASMGVGAALVERKVSVTFSLLVGVLEKFGEPALAVVGFFTAIVGRALQAIGIFIELAFTIVFLTTTIKALNIVLKDQAISKFLMSMSQAKIITESLASVFPGLAASLSYGLKSLATSALSVKTAFDLIKVSVLAMSKAVYAAIAQVFTAMTPYLITFGWIAAIIAAVVAVGYLLYLAFVKINDVTGVFSDMAKWAQDKWATFVKWWNSTNIFRDITIWAMEAYTFLNVKFIGVIYWIAEALVAAYAAFKMLALGYYGLKEASIGLSEKDKENVKGIEESIKGNQNLIKELEKRKGKEQDAANAALEAYKKTIVARSIASENTKKHTDAVRELADEYSRFKKEVIDTSLFKLASQDVQKTFTDTVEAIKEARKELMKKDLTEEERTKYTAQYKYNIELAIKQQPIVQLSEAVGVIDAATKGSASLLKAGISAAATSFLGPLGKIVGDVAGQIIDVFGKSPEEFRRMIIETLKMLPQLIGNILINIINIEKIVSEGIVALIDQLPAVIEAVTYQLTVKMSDPMFWVDITIAFVRALMRSIPAAGEGMARGFFNGLEKSLGGMVPAFTKAGEWIVDGFKKALEKLGDLFKNIFKFDGGGKGVVEKFLGFDFPFLAFAKGGMVPGQAKTMGDNALNDTVPALLSPGEMVIPRSVMQMGVNGIQQFISKIGTSGLQKASVGDETSKSVVQALKGLGIQPERHFGLGDIIGDIGGAIGGFFGGAWDAVSGSINMLETFIQDVSDKTGIKFDAPVKITQNMADEVIAQAMNNPVWRLIADNILPLDLIEVIRSLIRMGASIDVKQFIKDPVNEAKRAVMSIMGNFKAPFWKLMKFQDGGIVPGQSYSGDRQTVRVNSGEMILNDAQQSRLFKMLDDRMSTNEQKVIQIETRVMLEEKELARAMDSVRLNGWARA